MHALHSVKQVLESDAHAIKKVKVLDGTRRIFRYEVTATRGWGLCVVCSGQDSFIEGEERGVAEAAQAGADVPPVLQAAPARVLAHVAHRDTAPPGQHFHHVAQLRPDRGVVKLPLFLQFLEILCPVAAGIFKGPERGY